jgi:hypothetical protein
VHQVYVMEWQPAVAASADAAVDNPVNPFAMLWMVLAFLV